ncbi:MAG: exonuclease [Alphaproteobacteria bacterium]|nr:exonuclease [Alphaproteobacteria bacterium]
MKRFVAIDFETADHRPDSACAVGLALVADGRIADTAYHLIRPPRREFVFTWVHGITWADVAASPSFAEAWPAIAAFLDQGDTIAAHNAGFDRAVLTACCRAAGIEPPPRSFLCTVRLARTAWRVYPTKLPDVCRHLAIQLDHHHAASDARACAEILLAALQDGVDPACATIN